MVAHRDAKVIRDAMLTTHQTHQKPNVKDQKTRALKAIKGRLRFNRRNAIIAFFYSKLNNVTNIIKMPFSQSPGIRTIIKFKVNGDAVLRAAIKVNFEKNK